MTWASLIGSDKSAKSLDSSWFFLFFHMPGGVCAHLRVLHPIHPFLSQPPPHSSHCQMSLGTSWSLPPPLWENLFVLPVGEKATNTMTGDRGSRTELGFCSLENDRSIFVTKGLEFFAVLWHPNKEVFYGVPQTDIKENKRQASFPCAACTLKPFVPWEPQLTHPRCWINWLGLGFQAWSHRYDSPIPWVIFLFGHTKLFPDVLDGPEFKATGRKESSCSHTNGILRRETLLGESSKLSWMDSKLLVDKQAAGSASAYRMYNSYNTYKAVSKTLLHLAIAAELMGSLCVCGAWFREKCTPLEGHIKQKQSKFWRK